MEPLERSTQASDLTEIQAAGCAWKASVDAQSRLAANATRIFMVSVYPVNVNENG
jgi:hypothetical protein